MSRRWYSKRHYDSVLNRGTGNPPATEAEKSKTWRDMIAQHPDRVDVREACEALIREHGGLPVITVDKLTDEMVRALLVERDPTVPRLTLTERAWCLTALRMPIGKLATASRSEARAKVAEILNTRAAARSEK